MIASLRPLMVAEAAENGLDAREAALRAVAPFSAMLTVDDLESVVESLVADAAGLGPLESLLADPTVDEVMVNRPDEVWVERAGRIERVDARFDSPEALRDAIDRVLAPTGRRADDLMPLVDARLADGSRVNVALPPLAVDGPTLTIRRFQPEGFSLDRLVACGTLDRRLAGLLECAVADGLNLLVSGATGSGKTTTLGALARAIPSSQRVVTIEDAAELRLDHPHVVRLEARPPGPGGGGEVVIRDLVRNSLRMRPDRLVVGEVRGPEAADMLDAMATGHAGSLSTVHAGSPRAALERLATLAHQAALGLPHEAVTQRIAGAIDLVVQQCRLPSGARVVSSAAVVGWGDGLTVDTIFRLEGGQPVWRAAGSGDARSRLRFT